MSLGVIRWIALGRLAHHHMIVKCQKLVFIGLSLLGYNKLNSNIETKWNPNNSNFYYIIRTINKKTDYDELYYAIEYLNILKSYIIPLKYIVDRQFYYNLFVMTSAKKRSFSKLKLIKPYLWGEWPKSDGII